MNEGNESEMKERERVKGSTFCLGIRSLIRGRRRPAAPEGSRPSSRRASPSSSRSEDDAADDDVSAMAALVRAALE